MELAIKNKGFTLIELIVVLAIFSMVILVMLGIFVSLVQSQRKAIAIQDTQEISRYLLESMTKEIRMSKINSAVGNNLSVLNITNSKGETFNYSFDGVNKKLLRDAQNISPDNIEITGGFYVIGSSVPAQYRVTTVIKARAKSLKVEEESIVNLQSTIAVRKY